MEKLLQQLEQFLGEGTVQLRILGGAMLLGLGAALSAQPATAQEFDDTAFLDAMPVVLTATRLAQRPQDAPASVFVIDRQMIEASGAREVIDLLRLAPGFLVASVNGHQRTAGYHGFLDDYGQRLQVMVDGRSVYFPVLGGVRWSTLPLAIADIERIEVIRGANSATHGTNAFLGTVNIITRSPDTVTGITAEVLAGDPDLRQGMLRFGHDTGSVATRITLGYEEDSGFPNLDFPDHVPQVAERHDSHTLSMVALNSRLSLENGDSAVFSTGWKGGTAGLGTDSAWDIGWGGEGYDRLKLEDPVRDSQVNQGFANLIWEHVRSANSTLELHAYYNRFDLEDRKESGWYTGSPELLIPMFVADVDNGRIEERIGLELQENREWSETVRSVSGFELRRDRTRSEILFRNRAGRVENDLYRLFGSLEWAVSPRVTINGGATIDHDDLVGTTLSPRLGLNWHLDEHQTLRAAASSASRSPTFLEQYADHYWLVDVGGDGGTDMVGVFGRSSGDLKEERVDGIELAYLFGQGSQGGLSGDVKLAYDRFSNMIFGTRVPIPASGDPEFDYPYPSFEEDAASLANYIGFDIASLDLNLQYEPDPTLRFIASAHWSRMENLEVDLTPWQAYLTEIGPAPKILENDIPNLPNSLAHPMYSLQVIAKPAERLTASMTLSHAGETWFLRTGDETAAYTRADFRLARSLGGHGYDGEIEAVWQNLGGSYDDFTKSSQRDGNLFEPRFYLGVKLGF